jgi:hypothetical protein
MRRPRTLELVLGLWAAVWIAVAVQVGIEVRGLRDLSTTMKRTGVAARESGAALERLDGVPVIGAELREPARRVQEAGENAIARGESSRDSIRALSVLLAVAIGVIPIVAVLGVFLELRARRGARAIRAP